MSKKIVNDIKRGPLGNCVVLHDFSTPDPKTIKEWFYYTVKFFEDHNVIPNRSSGTKKSRQNISFDRALRQYEKQNFVDLEECWLGAVPPDASQEGLDSLFSTHLNGDPAKKNKTLVLTFDDQIVPFTPSVINKLAADLSEFFRPKYGYAYQRDFDKGPTWYPFGICVDLDWDKDREERTALTKWNHHYHINDRYKTGDLRDIYPMNLLSAAHQKHIVEGKPFFEWIQADPRRGTLTPLNQSLWAWWVQPTDIPAVREALRPLGWVIAV